MFLDKFKEVPKEKVVILITIIGLAIVILTTLLIFMPIEALVPTYGILDYEFAWTPERVETIFSVWSIDGIIRQTSAVYWDFLYIVGYVSLAFGLILLVFRRFSTFSGSSVEIMYLPVISPKRAFSVNI